MEQFSKRHEGQVIGVLSGFDRVRFRGTLRWLANVAGLDAFLGTAGVLLKDFKGYAMQITQDIRQATAALAETAGRPVRYLASSSVSKEAEARRIAAADGVREGLIAVLTCVEPCFSYQVGPNREAKKLELRGGQFKCLHQYFYLIDPRFGFMHLRLQTWFPFTIHVCINGREWLARQMDAAGIDYVRRDNCFINISEVAGAQRLLDRQLTTNWTARLDALVRQYHPTHRRVFAAWPLTYYWSADETEWATDVMFQSPRALGRVYPRLVRHSMQSLSCGDVMRFLGRKTPAHGGVHGGFAGAVSSDCRRRPEGVRVMHRLNRNSIKMYDKQHSVLRVETTINHPRDMKVYRRSENAARTAPKQWQRLRKGVADLRRRAQLSQAANERYLDSLATVDTPTPLGELTAKLCRPARLAGRRVRALNPLATEDLRLLEAVRRGEFALHGMRNRDLRQVLWPTRARSAAEERRRAAKVTRQLRLLRAHGLIRKVSGTHRYILTANGAQSIDALLAARNANTEKLQQLAA